MALVNHAKKEINAKIVYYGPAGSGKNTALTYIYSRIKPSLRGDFKTVPAGADNLLFFDFNPFETPLANGYRIRLHIYTLTGPVSNPATWKMTLKGADGIIVMINPAAELMADNNHSISQLRDFLSAYGVGLHDIPAILQLNSFIQDDLTGEECDVSTALDLTMMPTCRSHTASGIGLLEAMTTLSRQVLDKITVMNESRETNDTSDVNITSEFAAQASSDLNITAPAKEDAISEFAQISLPQGIIAEGGIIRIPLEVSVGGVLQKLAVSISIELQ